ncbi:DUF4846 domain-containing protein [uncultured Tenacibaculum sp.]|uniref:DUF4846 domain-containing protein n=1 Tax=uncultured Tenacibaculum sp. TaxID=174713 RepID=UPI002624774A|nr:DUF4846 domain-containing protein [uncultured Tenacibaculum sp.]
MKKILSLTIIALLALFLLLRTTTKGKQYTNHIEALILSPQESLINKEGETIKTRVKPPKGYKRSTIKNTSFQQYLRNYKLKKHGTEIINHDGTKYFAQNWHDAILEIPVPKNGLQQCADALMRIRAEYLWDQNRKNEIGFKFTSGHYCSWKKYAEGFRAKVKGNKVSSHKTANPNHSKANFYKYLNLIYTYAGTASLHSELKKVQIKDLQIGDMLVQPGYPGHIEIIVDEVINDKGEKLFLLAQGNTPAQSVCLLKNFEDDNISPWYKFSSNLPVYTPSYYFEKPIFIRFK